ncbi:protein argonaute 4A [Triticum aestivum]|uniref:protein argonaute 4A n=1 Tax=Triticum aestivum TaxID=4565 RepID=UPI001D029963|nr:protein argonaute 4A-like [Triticum aestivum]
MKQLHETYASLLDGKQFAYDGDKSLFTSGPLPFATNDFDVVIDGDALSRKIATSQSPGADGSPGPSDKKRMKQAGQSKRFKVDITFTAKVPISAIALVLGGGQESENSQEVLRVLDIILRQHAARQNRLLVRQSFFRRDSDCIKLGGGVLGCQGFHSSIRPTQSGLLLNCDLSTTMVVEPGPVIAFLLSNQGVKDTSSIDWGKAKRALNKLRIETTHTKAEFRIVGLSENSCYNQTFPLKQKDGNGTVDVTVYDYFMDRWSMKLEKSAHMPCLNVGKPNRPTYLPLEVCRLVPLQRYKRSLSTSQRSKLVEASRQRPDQRMSKLYGELRANNYDSEPMMKECGISIVPDFTQVQGRVLEAPQLSAADGRQLYTPNGRWNFNKNRFFRPIDFKKTWPWGVVDFSTRRDVEHLVEHPLQSGSEKGIVSSLLHLILSLFKCLSQFDLQSMEKYSAVIQEIHKMKHQSPAKRVEDMFRQVNIAFGGNNPEFLLCFLPEKNSDIYGPWKRECLAQRGIVTQCLVPPPNVKDQYLTNVLLKINAKLGGLNSLLKKEITHAIPHVSRIPTIIFGMDVSHGSPGRDVPSVAAVVSSLEWPIISKYRASVCTLPPRQEMIKTLFKQDGDTDHGLIKDSLVAFLGKNNKPKPEQIIIFRDGVSESQFDQVLNDELGQIMEACKFFGDKHFGGNWFPKFTVIVAQKNHHTRFFLRNGVNNVPPGTVVDGVICHPRNYDFYMCAHAGIIGTTRPTHYHVLHDEIGFSTDDLQELVHSLSYTYQRSTTAISVVAPIYYAHLAAAHVAKFTKLDDGMSETSSQAEAAPVPELPFLHPNVASSMFFC